MSAKLIDRSKLEIGDQITEADIVVIAAGAAPRKMNIPGEDYLTTSDEFMDRYDVKTLFFKRR